MNEQELARIIVRQYNLIEELQDQLRLLIETREDSLS